MSYDKFDDTDITNVSPAFLRFWFTQMLPPFVAEDKSDALDVELSAVATTIMPLVIDALSDEDLTRLWLQAVKLVREAKSSSSAMTSNGIAGKLMS